MCFHCLVYSGTCKRRFPCHVVQLLHWCLCREGRMKATSVDLLHWRRFCVGTRWRWVAGPVHGRAGRRTATDVGLRQVRDSVSARDLVRHALLTTAGGISSTALSTLVLHRVSDHHSVTDRQCKQQKIHSAEICQIDENVCTCQPLMISRGDSVCERFSVACWYKARTSKNYVQKPRDVEHYALISCCR